MATSSDFGFIHRFEPATNRGLPPLLVLHGTGGDENDLVPLAQRIAPGAAILSPRGKVLEMGQARYFRRLEEGVFDADDLNARTDELAGFVREAQAAYKLDKPVALGFSNGANVAWSLLLRHPDLLAGAVLLRALLPFEPGTVPPLTGRPVLIVLGESDPLIPVNRADKLPAVLRAAGAAVTLKVLPTGHGLTTQDLMIAKDWLAQQRKGA
jgi:phospholipase/carboxylesterase